MFHSSPETDLLKLLLQAEYVPDEENSPPNLKGSSCLNAQDWDPQSWDSHWDPQSGEMETYLQSLEQSWPEDLIADYEAIVPTLNKVLNITPEALLSDRFPGIPHSILQHIGEQVKVTGLELLSLSEQLLHCVQDLFPGWAIEDLQVLARPYAYAFRSGTPAFELPEAIEWNQLSDLEQIRLCFQISKVALDP